MARLLPQSLVGRVFLLYAITLAVFVIGGLGSFFRFHVEQSLEDAQQAAQMVNELAAQIVTESAVIGDFDTIQRTLDKAVSRSPFASAAYIDLSGGTLRATASQPPSRQAPDWMRALIEQRLSDLNQVITAGGRDYGVLRMSFDGPRIARDLWLLVEASLLVAAAALAGGMLMILYPLGKWLGTLDRALQVGQHAQPEHSPELESLMQKLPLELRPMVLALDRTATSLRSELEARERALVSLREVLSDMQALPAPASSATDELTRLSSAIARLVSEREAGRQALERALDAAETANRTKTEFLANMSHEIRTPINGIVGMTDLALETPLTDEQREFLTTARNSADALMSIVNDILDFSRIEAGQLAVERIAFDPRDVANEACSVVQPMVRARGLTLETRVDPRLPPSIVGDPTRLRQAMLNLLGNAVKFTAEGRIDVALRLAEDGPGPPTLEISVRDTGVGIPADKHEQVFEAFAQADASTTRRYGGSGLGLSITRRLVALMGGCIRLDSAPGRGSTFVIALPLQASAPVVGGDATGCAAVPAESAPEPPAALVADVLVVEDNPVNRLMLERMLERIGCRVAVACDGAEAVARFAAEPFDAVLMDLQMPVKGGLEATGEIRDLERLRGARRTPVIAVTANAVSGDREACLAAGMDDYLTKPYTSRQLRDMLERWTGRDPVDPDARGRVAGSAAVPPQASLPNVPVASASR